MKRLLATTMVLMALAGFFSTAYAQLINIDKNYRISKLDRIHNRLEVQYLTGKDVTLFVNLDGNTQVLNNNGGRMRWTLLRRGDVIQVKGGLQTDGQIRGKTIILQNG